MADGDYERRAASTGRDAREFERIRRFLAAARKAREAAAETTPGAAGKDRDDGARP